jgi:urease accessory protein
MYASAWPSEAIILPAPPARQRAEGRANLAVARLGDHSRAVRIAESGPLRLRLPRAAGPGLEAVLLNTGGGIACGDRFSVDVSVGERAEIALTTPAAERAYGSDGPTATIDVRLSVAGHASLAWLPQETILFDRTRLLASLDAEIEPSARLLLFAAFVFGRSARGERVAQGLLVDRWRIRRGGELILADTLRLSGPIDALLERPAIAGGSRALASLVYVAPDAESRLEEARAILGGASGPCGASAWNGLLAVRFLAPEIESLRRDIMHFLTAFRGRPLPRVWQS